MKRALKMDDSDNVATATSKVLGGESVAVISSEGEVVMELQARLDIPFGHKLALQGIDVGEEIVKYGEVIGVASEGVLQGEWVHTHNVESGRLPIEGDEEGVF
ncbi:MAG: UxaA family hydrolase [Candidatus Bathyarchaeia archaeon]